MACYYPVQGYRSRTLNPSGKRGIVFDTNTGYLDRPVTLCCGRCTGCRLERSRQWAMRCVHEASLHEENAFITLTYDDDHLPAGGTLKKKDYQDFMKALRHYYYPKRIRYYMCGEYGEQSVRPHYHACLFGLDFTDKVCYTEKQGIRLYISSTLNHIWKKGFTTVGEVTFDSAAYVARYIMKKINGEKAYEHYKSIDFETGEIFDLIPEYTTMSRRPGIGREWYKKWKEEVYPEDEVVIRGIKQHPPRYYDTLYDVEQPKEMEKIKSKRTKAAQVHKKNNTPERLAVRERVKKAQMFNLKRTI